MNFKRKNSLDTVILPEWRWLPFLEEIIKSLSIFHPLSVDLDHEYLEKESKITMGNKSFSAITNTWACRTKKLSIVRAACVEAGQAASVLNLVCHPFHYYDLPFFGADFVTLPSGHLLALDLQPALKDDPLHTSFVWERLTPIHEKWQPLLPTGGKIPNEAKPYFSPGFLWSRLPLDSESDKLIETILMDAFLDYLKLYLDLIQNSLEVSEERSKILLEGQKRYLCYRSEKDPARSMLTRFYGKQWTETYIRKVLFNL